MVVKVAADVVGRNGGENLSGGGVGFDRIELGNNEVLVLVVVSAEKLMMIFKIRFCQNRSVFDDLSFQSTLSIKLI